MKPQTLNKDGTPRKKHRKGAGRPDTGRNVPIAMRQKAETLEAIKRLATHWNCSQSVAIEKLVTKAAKKLPKP